jgi:hypothetical protein
MKPRALCPGYFERDVQEIIERVGVESGKYFCALCGRPVKPNPEIMPKRGPERDRVPYDVELTETCSLSCGFGNSSRAGQSVRTTTFHIYAGRGEPSNSRSPEA